MSDRRSRRPGGRARLVPVAALVAGLSLSAVLTGCATTRSEPEAAVKPVAATAPVPSASPTAIAPLESQFTRDGTYQSHIDVEGIDFVYTIYPTKSTPRTNEWYPRGDKFFSFTFQAYDLSRKLRDKFSTKRKVYLDRIRVTSRTISPSGSTMSPYQLADDARRITFDPEPTVEPRYGMLITSPKGAFELRNQRLSTMPDDTRGLVLTFTAVVHVQQNAKDPAYRKMVIREKVPISIFASNKTTAVARIPVNAN